MLPGSGVPGSTVSRTRSDPTPTSRSCRFTSAAPAQVIVGGAVKIALSSRYSQLPVNWRLDITWARLAASRPPCGMMITGSRTPSAAESPSASGFTARSPWTLSRPNPVAWS